MPEWQVNDLTQVSEVVTPEFVGLRLSKEGQIYFVPYVEVYPVQAGTKVLVQVEQGDVLGEVFAVYRSGQGVDTDTLTPGASLLGVASARDIAIDTENRLLAAEAAAYCKTCIRQRKLEMKLIEVIILHDRSKIIFFFTAPTRIDFRELVKDLVRSYRTRIELRQIGVRHETQILGGLGNCGRVCCCHGYLRKFAPVTIKMAKEQNLFLNPAKLSGLCGRLLCCLSFEQNNYEEFNRRSPRLGKRYKTGSGMFKVVRANMFNQSIVCLTEGGEEKEFSLEEWEALNPTRSERPGENERPPRSEGRGRSRNDGEGEEGRRPQRNGRPEFPNRRGRAGEHDENTTEPFPEHPAATGLVAPVEPSVSTDEAALNQAPPVTDSFPPDSE